MTPITDDFQSHMGLAVIVTSVIEVAKRLNIPFLGWINQRSTGVSIALSTIAAFVMSLGFQMQWEGTWLNFGDLLQNGGHATLSVAIPSLDTLVRAVGQVGLQFLTYHGMIKPVVAVKG